MVNFINIANKAEQTLIFDKPGDYVVFIRNLSGKIIFDIFSKNVQLNIFGLYIGRNNDQFFLNTVQRHLSPNSTSNLLIKGVFYDQAKFHYEGLVRIEKEAQKSHAYQKNQNLILSDQVFVQSKPYLEILANDVFCTHGSTTGKINKDEVNYLQTRGIDKKQSENILIKGFINDIVGKVKKIYPAFNI